MDPSTPLLAVAVVGSREFKDPESARAAVDAAIARVATNHPNAVILSGGARGVDTWAEEAAKRHGLVFERFPADWTTYGRGAGFRRNTEMVTRATHVLAFWNKSSRGTMDTVNKARAAGKPVALWQPG